MAPSNELARTGTWTFLSTTVSNAHPAQLWQAGTRLATNKCLEDLKGPGTQKSVIPETVSDVVFMIKLLAVYRQRLLLNFLQRSDALVLLWL